TTAPAQTAAVSPSLASPRSATRKARRTAGTRQHRLSAENRFLQCKKAAGNHFPKRCCPNATRVRKSLPRRADALIGHPAVIGRQASVAGVRLRAVQCPPDAGSGIGTSYDPQSRQGVIGPRYAYQTTSDCCPRGYYVIDDGVLTMAKANGIPVRRPEGGEYTTSSSLKITRGRLPEGPCVSRLRYTRRPARRSSSAICTPEGP